MENRAISMKMSIVATVCHRAYLSIVSGGVGGKYSSNIVSLALPDTVPMDVDLQDILTWPKALKWYFHQSQEGHHHHFQLGGGGYIASPQYFLESLAVQHDSLQELIYNHGEDCCGNDESLFDPALMRSFVDLEY